MQVQCVFFLACVRSQLAWHHTVIAIGVQRFTIWCFEMTFSHAKLSPSLSDWWWQSAIPPAQAHISAPKWNPNYAQGSIKAKLMWRRTNVNHFGLSDMRCVVHRSSIHLSTKCRVYSGASKQSPSIVWFWIDVLFTLCCVCFHSSSIDWRLVALM